MSALSIDFARRSRVTPFGVLAVAGALALACAFFVQDRQLVSEAGDLEKRLAAALRAIDRDRTARPAVPPAQLTEEINRANAVIRQLGLPWGKLFADLEAATTPEVTLLAIEPDAENRKIRISGEAKQFPSLVAYINRLEEREVLADVWLASHELRAGSSKRPVIFTIQGDWRWRP
jgi:hypothetical protein